MIISVSSVCSALFFYSVVLGFVCWLRRRTHFAEKGGAPVLLLLSGIATLKLLLPYEIPFTHAIRSWHIMGSIVKFFRTYPAVTQFLLVVWGVGAVIVLGKDIVDLYRSRRRSRNYRKCTDAQDKIVQKLAKQCSAPCMVVVSPDVKVPYVAGFFHHTIYFPVSTLPEKKLELALRHEIQHIRNHDVWIKLFFGCMTALIWWNPIAHVFRHEVDALLEIHCDAKVTKFMSPEERLEYGTMLKDMVKEVMAGQQMPALALDESHAVGRNRCVIEQRVNIITERTAKMPRRLRTVMECAMVVVFFASYLVIFQPAVAPDTKRFEEEAGISYYDNYADLGIGEEAFNAFIVKDANGRYQLCVNYEFSRYLTEDEVNSDRYQGFPIFEEDR